MAIPRPMGMEMEPDASAMLDALDQHLDEQPRVRMFAHLPNGTTSRLRVEPSRAVQFVQIHVQTAAVYNPASDVGGIGELDCQVTRIQDASFTRDGVSTYYAWAIPVVVDGWGVKQKLDGQGGNPDAMWPLLIGV